MAHRTLFVVVLLGFSLFLWPGQNHAEDEETAPMQLREPLKLDEMTPYEKIPFEVKNFQKVERGMTEEQVLGLLGKPLELKTEKRRGNRWTAHYSYEGGYVVNFSQGLVVGKESP